MSPSWATTTNRSTAGAARKCRTFSSSSSTSRIRPWSSWSKTTAARTRSSAPPIRSSNTIRAAARSTSGARAAMGEKVRLIEAPNDREEGQFVAEEIQRRPARAAISVGKFRRPLPHERAIARARGKSAPPPDPLSDRGREKFLRPPRSQGSARLHVRARESRRRRQPAPHHQHAGARHQRGHRSIARCSGACSTSAASGKRCSRPPCTRDFSARTVSSITRFRRIGGRIRNQAARQPLCRSRGHRHATDRGRSAMPRNCGAVANRPRKPKRAPSNIQDMLRDLDAFHRVAPPRACAVFSTKSCSTRNARRTNRTTSKRNAA